MRSTGMSKRRVLLIGQSYKGTVVPQLNATLGDVQHMQQYLLNEVGFQPQEVLTLVDDCAPLTCSDIVNSIRGIGEASRIEKLKYVLIYYSGHGTGVQDFSRDEADGQDECLVASDGLIPDDDIRALLLKSMDPDTLVVVVTDCCASGTILDISPCDIPGCAKVIQLSGCRDDQVSEEGQVDWLAPGINVQSGFLTGALLRVLREDPTRRSSALLTFQAMKRFMHRVGMQQEPQLQTNFELTPDTPFLQ